MFCIYIWTYSILRENMFHISVNLITCQLNHTIWMAISVWLKLCKPQNSYQDYTWDGHLYTSSNTMQFVLSFFVALLYLGAFVLFLQIERSFLSFTTEASFGSGFALCVASSGSSLLSAGVALLAWRHQVNKFHGRKYSVLRYRSSRPTLDDNYFDAEDEWDQELV